MIKQTSIGAPTPSLLDAEFAILVDQLTARFQSGESVEMEPLFEEHPQHADRLRQLLPAIRALVDMGLSPSTNDARQTNETEDSEPAPKALGDFVIVREVGRGGMGVVYEATQISLGRRVALKVLPLVGALDQRQLRRFKTEAQAAASLHHQNIVPIHGVGCDRGVHYYAMQFIDGRTLADVLREMISYAKNGSNGQSQGGMDRAVTASQPAGHPLDRASEKAICDGQNTSDKVDSRAETQRVQQAAFATERATSSPSYIRGIVEMGIQVADALEHAHLEGVLHRDIKPSNLILDGSGKVWVTDFGLARIEADSGLTMTGDIVGTLRYMSPEQALAKCVLVDERTDVYSLCATLYELLTLQAVFGDADRHELLRKIASQEPRPPRQLNRAVPVELGVILLKGLEKNPDHRYRSARALADDLRRFLDSRPIHAKPPTLIQKAVKWSNRHRPMVWTAACSTAMVLFATVLILAISNAKVKREQREKSVALEERTSALKERAAALAKADSNLEKAFEVIDRMLTRVAEKELPNVPEMEPVKKAILEDALEFCLRFLEQNSADSAIRMNAAQALKRLAVIYQAHTWFGGSLRASLAAHAILQKLVREDPSNGALQAELADTSFRIGNLYCRHLDDIASAEPFLRECASLHQYLSKNWPTNPFYGIDSAHFATELAFVLTSTGRRIEAIQILREGVTESQRLVNEFPDEKPLQSLLGLHLIYLAEQIEPNDLASAEAIYRQSIAIGDAHMDGWHLAWLIHAKCNLASLLKRTGRDSELDVLYTSAVALADRVIEELPQGFYQLGACSRARCDWAAFLTSQLQYAEAEQVLQRTWRDLHFAVSHGYYDCHRFQAVSQLLVESMKRIDRSDQVEQVHRTTVALIQELVDDFAIDHDQMAWTRLLDDDQANRRGSKFSNSDSVEIAMKLHHEKRLGQARIALASAKITLARFLNVTAPPSELGKIVSEFQPITAHGFVDRALLYFEIHENEKAAQDLSRALQLEPSIMEKLTAAELWEVALAADKSGRFNEATKFYRLSLQHDLNNDSLSAAFYHRLNFLSYGGGGTRKRAAVSLQYAREAVKRAPEEVRWLVVFGGVLFQNGLEEEAIGPLERANKIEPSHLAVNLLLARSRAAVYLRQRRYSDSVAEYTNAIRMSPNDWWLYSDRATPNFELGNYEAALADLDRALRLNPSNTNLLTWAANAKVAKCTDETFRTGILQLADQMIERNPGEAKAYAASAILHTLFGRNQRARQDLNQVRMLESKSANDWYQSALIYLMLEEPEMYRDLCRTTVKLFAATQDATNAYWTAWSCALVPGALEQYDECIRLCEIALSNARSETNLNALGAILMRSGRHAEAISRLNEAIATRGNAASANTSPAYSCYFLALAHHHQGDIDQSRHWLQKANEHAKQESLANEYSAWNRAFTLELLQREAESLGDLAEL